MGRPVPHSCLVAARSSHGRPRASAILGACTVGELEVKAFQQIFFTDMLQDNSTQTRQLARQWWTKQHLGTEAQWKAQVHDVLAAASTMQYAARVDGLIKAAAEPVFRVQGKTTPTTVASSTEAPSRAENLVQWMAPKAKKSYVHACRQGTHLQMEASAGQGQL